MLNDIIIGLVAVLKLYLSTYDISILFIRPLVLGSTDDKSELQIYDIENLF